MLPRTTIHVDLETLAVLDRYKKAKAFKNYSEAIRKLLEESREIPKSEKGSLRRLQPLIREKIYGFA